LGDKSPIVSQYVIEPTVTAKILRLR